MITLTPEQIAHVRTLGTPDHLTAAEVLTDAAREESPLHPLFEWNDTRAAREYRLTQARTVIRSVEYHVIQDRITITVPRYVPDPTRPGNQPGYLSVDAAARDPLLATQAVIAELNRALGVLRRAEMLSLALGQGGELTPIVQHVQLLRDTLRDGPAAGERSAA